MIGTVIIPNGIAIVMLLVLLLSAKSLSGHRLLLDSKIFYLMVICNLFQCVGEMFAYAIDGIMLPGFHGLNLFANSLLFIVTIMFAFLWAIYADYKIYEDIGRLRTRGKTMAVPAIVIMAGALINLFTPVFFTITAENHYFRTGLYPLPFLVTYFYLGYGTLFIYRHKSQAKKYVFLPAIVFMIPIILGSSLQFFCYGVSTVWVGGAIALTAVYVNVQNETSYIDALSGLYTRIYMYQYLETARHKKSSERKLAGIMLDIDAFKMINDTYGHIVGDDAIRSAGKILHVTMNGIGIAVRYGGDEFVVLFPAETNEDIEKIMARISDAVEVFNKTKGKTYDIRFSMGCSIMKPEETIDTFLDRMDKAMYEVKKAAKQ